MQSIGIYKYVYFAVKLYTIYLYEGVFDYKTQNNVAFHLMSTGVTFTPSPLCLREWVCMCEEIVYANYKRGKQKWWWWWNGAKHTQTYAVAKENMIKFGKKLREKEPKLRAHCTLWNDSKDRNRRDCAAVSLFFPQCHVFWIGNGGFVHQLNLKNNHMNFWTISYLFVCKNAETKSYSRYQCLWSVRVDGGECVCDVPFIQINHKNSHQATGRFCLFGFSGFYSPSVTLDLGMTYIHRQVLHNENNGSQYYIGKMAVASELKRWLNGIGRYLKREQTGRKICSL